MELMEKKLCFDWKLKSNRTYKKFKKSPLITIDGLKKSYKFKGGDILKVVYIAKNNAYTFNGVCMGVRGKFKNPNMSFILRNIIIGVGIEMIFSYFVNRLFKLYIEFYKKKHHFYRKSRLFFIRFRINRQSRVK
jgi:ribosomal protein L19